MNGAMLIGVAAVVLPIALCEARRKWRDGQFEQAARAAVLARSRGADPFRDHPNNALDAARSAGGPVWMGYDHGSDSYAGGIDCAAGNSSDVSTSDGGYAGGDA